MKPASFVIIFSNFQRLVRSTEKESMIDSDDDGQWDSRQTQKVKDKTSTPVKGISDVQKAISKTDWRLALVPLVFLLFRFWGNLRFFVSMIKDCRVGVLETEELNGFFCITEDCFDVLYNEVILAMHVRIGIKIILKGEERGRERKREVHCNSKVVSANVCVNCK